MAHGPRGNLNVEHPQNRPLIDINAYGHITHNGTKTKVVLRKKLISVGCSDITLDALNYILAKHNEIYGENNDAKVVLQTGEISPSTNEEKR